jgi:tryptophan synthase alpha chain
MTSRITKTFEELTTHGRKGFIPFVTGGDPTVELSESIVLSIAESGADVIELGVPFSDPMADGPTIQRSSQRALQNGATLLDVLSIAKRLRSHSNIPVVLFSYLNPLLSHGIDRLISDSLECGVDGILITDAVDFEADQLRQPFFEAGIDLISLIAPTTSDARLKTICERAQGFIYAVSRAGVTGTRSETSEAASTLVGRARQFTDRPIAVGFGISTPDQISDVWQYADAAVVGSAIVAEIERNLDSPSLADDVARYIGRLVPSFAKKGVET